MKVKRAMKYALSGVCTLLAKRAIGNYGSNLKVNFPCRFTKKVSIGNNCHFNGVVITGNGSVVIGDNFHSAKNVRIITSSHNYMGESLPYDNTLRDYKIVIDDNVWIGENVIVLGDVHIGEGAIIQAGSVVCKDIPALSIAGGHPAIAFAYRDEDHYLALKSEHCFLR